MVYNKLAMNEVRVRMAPSPTGNLHLGTAYATLWPFLFSKKNKGTFILRIEDTDRERSTKEFEENIIEGLKWLGLNWDEGPFHQMDRLDLYKEHAQKLIDQDKAYYCFCTKEELDAERKLQTAEHLPQVYSGKCRLLTNEEVKQKMDSGKPYVIRLKVPEERGVVEFDDLIHGKISFESKLIGDTVIMRQSGIPLYNFAVVVDDIDMKISHVIRGDDHVSNTPKQILLFEAFEKSHPNYGHFPVILNQDREGKLSKRTGSASVDSYKHEGYLADAIINYLAFLGWSPPEGKEILSKEEIIELFDIKDMNKAPAAWNQGKLDWLNGEYIRRMSDEKLTEVMVDYLVDHPAKDKIGPLVPLTKERIKKLSDFIPLTDFIFNEPEYEMESFEKLKIQDTKMVLEKVLEGLESMQKPWKSDIFEKTFRDLAEELKIPAGSMFQLIRLVVSGQLVTPPLFESIQIIGEDKVISRVKKVLNEILK